MGLRIHSPLPEEVETIATAIVDSACEVHRQLGPGLLEAIYGDAMTIELEYRKLRFEREVEIALHYRERPLRSHRLDLVVEGKILVEIKAIDRLAPVHKAQVIGYLRASKYRLGLLINFNCDWLKGSIKRIIL